MTYKGHVENGMILADEPVDLPDGTVVRFEVARLTRLPPAMLMSLCIDGGSDRMTDINQFALQRAEAAGARPSCRMREEEDDERNRNP